jgi:signal transduction histidine kinase
MDIFQLETSSEDTAQILRLLKEAGFEGRVTALDVESVRQEERTRIAREIHDELGQLLTVLKMNLKMQEENLQHSGRIVRRQLLQEFESLSSIVDLTTQRVKKIATELRSPVSGDVGLVQTLESCAAEFQKNTGISCVVKRAPAEFSLEPQCATALLKILQEALTNVARHSHARGAIIVLERAVHTITLHVSDDGIGIPEEDIANPRSLGLQGMRERAALLGGSVSFERLGNEGTRVTLSLPLDEFLPQGQFSAASSS